MRVLNRGEISTIIVGGMIVVVGVATLLTNMLNTSRQTTNTQAAAGEFCGDNPPLAQVPSGYMWKALCDEKYRCHNNNDCLGIKNTLLPAAEQGNSYWCYGFDGPQKSWDDWRCMQLQRVGSGGSTPGQSSSTNPNNPPPSSTPRPANQEPQITSTPTPTRTTGQQSNDPGSKDPTTGQTGNVSTPPPSSSGGSTSSTNATPTPHQSLPFVGSLNDPNTKPAVTHEIQTFKTSKEVTAEVCPEDLFQTITNTVQVNINRDITICKVM